MLWWQEPSRRIGSPIITLGESIPLAMARHWQVASIQRYSLCFQAALLQSPYGPQKHDLPCTVL